MEQMTQELNIENYNLNAIKKLYNTTTESNIFLNIYTMIDIEDGKKKTFNYLMKKYNYQNSNYIQDFVESSSSILASELFKFNNVECNVTKGLVGPAIDSNNASKSYENHRIITIDSEYRNNLYKGDVYDSLSASNILASLNDTLDNTVSIELSNLCIPFTFYNINSDEGNNFFYIIDNSNGAYYNIDISSGNYNKTTLITNINNKISDESIDISLTLDTLTNKVKITNNSTNNTSYEIVFYDNSNDNSYNDAFYSKCSSTDIQIKKNNNLGWILGFRTMGQNDDDALIFSYNIEAQDDITSECICYIPYTKYFIIAIDDMNKSQSNKSLVQINNTKQQIKHTNYYKGSRQDNSLNCLKDCNEIDSYNSLTKNQIYSVIQKNKYRSSSNNTNNLTSNLINNIFAVIPFETKSLTWGESIFTSDKNKFKQKYNSPVDISTLSIKLMDDKGNLLNLNGADWSCTLISTHSYKI